MTRTDSPHSANLRSDSVSLGRRAIAIVVSSIALVMIVVSAAAYLGWALAGLLQPDYLLFYALSWPFYAGYFALSVLVSVVALALALRARSRMAIGIAVGAFTIAILLVATAPLHLVGRLTMYVLFPGMPI